ncbi:hypothetical protein [Kitasatospora griseola]|uniref:hypothetical protein n=1 Tax=Kitasatospora griseola TaxID=2064 RepID=UPI0034472D2F
MTPRPDRDNRIHLVIELPHELDTVRALLEAAAAARAGDTPSRPAEPRCDVPTTVKLR